MDPMGYIPINMVYFQASQFLYVIIPLLYPYYILLFISRTF